MIGTEVCKFCVDYCEGSGVTRSRCRSSVGIYFLGMVHHFFAEVVFTVVEFLENVGTISINAIKKCSLMVLSIVSSSAFSLIILDRALRVLWFFCCWICSVIILVVNAYEGKIEVTTGILVRCVEFTEAVNIVQFIVNCVHSVNHLFNRVDDEDLRVSGSK